MVLRGSRGHTEYPIIDFYYKGMCQNWSSLGNEGWHIRYCPENLSLLWHSSKCFSCFFHLSWKWSSFIKLKGFFSLLAVECTLCQSLTVEEQTQQLCFSTATLSILQHISLMKVLRCWQKSRTSDVMSSTTLALLKSSQQVGGLGCSLTGLLQHGPASSSHSFRTEEVRVYSGRPCILTVICQVPLRGSWARSKKKWRR